MGIAGIGGQPERSFECCVVGLGVVREDIVCSGGGEVCPSSVALGRGAGLAPPVAVKIAPGASRLDAGVSLATVQVVKFAPRAARELLGRNSHPMAPRRAVL